MIEHLASPGIALDHIVEMMAPGATLLVTTPNPRWSRSRLWALQSGYLACFTQADLDLNRHIFPVWPHILERMLIERGFEIAEYVTLDGATIWPGAPYSLRYPVRCAVAAMMMVLERRDPTACGMSYGVVANLSGTRRRALRRARTSPDQTDRIFTPCHGAQLLLIQHLSRHLQRPPAREFLIWHPLDINPSVDRFMRSVVSEAGFDEVLDIRDIESLRPRIQASGMR